MKGSLGSAVVTLAQTVISTPGSICNTVSDTQRYVRDRVNTTVDMTKDVVRSSMHHTQELAATSFRLVSRPFIWPLEVSLDLSQRVTVQVLMTVREVLDGLSESALALEQHLSKGNHEHAVLWTECDHCTQEARLCETRARALALCKQHVASVRKLRETNRNLTRRARVAESKYEALRTEIAALREMYCDKLADLELERDHVERQQRQYLKVIQSAQLLAKDCHGDVELLMEDIQDLARRQSVEMDDSSVESLSMDISVDDLTLLCQSKSSTLNFNDSDTGYGDDDTQDQSMQPIRRTWHRYPEDGISATSSLTSFEYGSQDDVSASGHEA